MFQTTLLKVKLSDLGPGIVKTFYVWDYKFLCQYLGCTFNVKGQTIISEYL